MFTGNFIGDNFIIDSYSSYDDVYNIAIVVLTNSLVFSASIQPIKLARQDEWILDLTKMSVSSRNAEDIYKLKHLNVKHISRSSCQNFYDVFVSGSDFCAEYLDLGQKGICYGDEGSPLVAQNTLYGIFSRE